VEDALLVRGRHTRGDLPGNREELAGLHRAAADALRKRLSLAVLHDDERDAVRPLVDLIDGGDVLVANRGG
jgi:hypothetical protein